MWSVVCGQTAPRPASCHTTEVMPRTEMSPHVLWGQEAGQHLSALRPKSGWPRTRVPGQRDSGPWTLTPQV